MRPSAPRLRYNYERADKPKHTVGSKTDVLTSFYYKRQPLLMAATFRGLACLLALATLWSQGTAPDWQTHLRKNAGRPGARRTDRGRARIS